jgi:predicted RNase H-like HicB family nuclease
MPIDRAIPRYAYRVFWSDEDGEFVAVCSEIPGLSGLAATEAGAIEELKVVIAGWLEHLSEQGIAWPEPDQAARTASVGPQEPVAPHR